ncbi:MAG: peptidoglycan editing factor PgeF [Clostridia bacterium]
MSKIDKQKEMSVIQKEGIVYYQFKSLKPYEEKLVHAFVGKPSDFRITQQGEDKELEKNYRKILTLLDLKPQNLIRPLQSHTDCVEIVDNQIEKEYFYGYNFENVDGMITNKIGLVLATIESDCTPILLYDPVQNVLANIHSGWRGTVQKIGQKAAIKMIEKFGCHPKDILCCMGPTIHPCHFEVEEEVKEIFKNTFSYLGNTNLWLKTGRIENGVQKYNINIPMIQTALMKEIGVPEENIENSNICTVCEVEHFHSYRKEGKQTGRNCLICALK